MDNDSDDSDMNDPGSLSMEISKENKELEVHPVEENNTPTFIHAHQENTTDDRNVNLETPSIQPIEDMIESMFNQSNTKELPRHKMAMRKQKHTYLYFRRTLNNQHVRL